MAHLITREVLVECVGAGNHGPTVKLHSVELPPLRAEEVLVKFIMAPIHPLDLLVLSNKYPVQPQFHHDGAALLGYDGVGEVLELGPNVSGLAPGDLVIPSQFGIGTWRSHAVLRPNLLQKITAPKDIMFASMLRLGVAPAYFLVEDMSILKPGDWIIQNAGTSVIAHYVTQFAALRGVNVIHIIRDRPDAAEKIVKKALQDGGAALVFTESELAERAASLRTSRRIMLALDAVYGTSGRLVMQALSDGGTYVQTGFLGGQQGELRLGSADLFGRRLTLKGFRGSAMMASRTAQQQSTLFNWFVQLYNRDELTLPSLGLDRIQCGWTEETSREVESAVSRAQNAAIGHRKQIMVFE